MNNKEHINILLVEDNPGDARLVAEMLTDSQIKSFELRHVEQVRDAEKILEEEEFDIVLSDISLPDGNGLEMAKRIFANQPNLPFLMLTGMDDDFLALDAIQNGIQDYLVKDSCNGEVLGRTIRHAIERQRLAHELKKSEARVRQIVEFINAGVIVVDKEGTVHFVNPAAEIILNRKAEELVGTFFDIPSTSGEVKELDFSHGGNRIRTIEIRTVDIMWEGKPASLVSLRNITEQKELEERLRLQATHDHLTGLPNRLLFEDRLNSAINRARRNRYAEKVPHEFILMMLDLDGFKVINDTYGHDQGDLVLIMVADRLRNAVRQTDTVARLGGDEFTLIFENKVKSVNADLLAKKILAVFAQPFQLDNGKVNVGTSIGVCHYPEDGDDADTLMKHADIALYTAKVEKNTFALFSKLQVAE